jgi:organic radical activating enzyme
MTEESQNNPQATTVSSPVTTLPVMESFYTLQGEGFHMGKAAYFIRLGGCDVGCFWCDVKESWEADSHPQKAVGEIVEQAEQAIKNLPSGDKPIIVITGGEPLLHHLDELTFSLQAKGFKTNIETSGSSPLSGYWDWICLSPKKFKKPLPEVLAVADELKVVIYNKSDFKWAEENAAYVSPKCRLYLQPEWGRLTINTPLIIEYIKAHPKWQLSLQAHKYIHIH